MEKIKYCPVCRKQVKINEKKCSCGYEFIEQEVVEDAVVSNTTVIIDNKPLGLWTFLGFISLSIAGFILFGVWKNSYPQRSKAALKGAISFLIFLGVAVIIALLYVVLDHFGKIV